MIVAHGAGFEPVTLKKIERFSVLKWYNLPKKQTPTIIGRFRLRTSITGKVVERI